MKDRLKASLGHLLFSLLALGVPLLLVTLHYYPGPLFWGDGGKEVIQLALAVDLILGPALTFCVYKKGKKGLMADLGLILALQLAAFGYGFFTMLEQRPVAYVFGGQFFHAPTQEQIEGAPAPHIERILGESPLPYFYVLLPEDLKQRERLAHEVIETGRPYHVQARLWKTREQVGSAELKELGMGLDGIKKIKSEDGRRKATEMLLAVSESRREEFRVVIMQLRYGNAVALFNVKTGLIEEARLADVGSLAVY